MVEKTTPHTRRTHGPTFKARLALAALRDDMPVAELCKEFERHAGQGIECNRPLLEGAADVFGGRYRAAAPVDQAPLHAKIGQLALENDFSERARTKSGFLSAKP